MFRVLWLTALFSGCITETTSELLTCELDVDAPTAELFAGEPTTVTGRPFTSLLDSSVRFGESEAEITAVERLDCTLCDQCRVSAQCTVCDECNECATSCETCSETMSLTIPDLPTGQYTVVFRNQYGLSIPLSWSIVNDSEDLDTDTD